jgi:tryptophanyl-tRNA synthetase
MKIRTNSLEPGEPKDPEDSILFAIYAAYATPAEVEDVRRRYAEGIAWGEMKQLLFEALDKELSGMRSVYERLMADLAAVESILRQGADKAREISVPFLTEIRRRVGVRPLG